MMPFYENKQEEIFSFIAKTTDFPVHLHIHMEIYYVVRGKIEVTVESETQLLSKGDMTVIFPNRVHGRAVVRSEDTLVIVIVAQPAFAGDFRKLVLDFAPKTPFFSSNGITNDVENSVKKIFEITNTNRSEPPEYRDTLLKSFMQIILSSLIPGMELIRHNRRDYDAIQRAVGFIMENFSEPISLEMVASHAGVTKNHLSSIFSGKMGMVFSDYLCKIRLGHACELLHGTDKSITEIAFESGFNTLRTFNRVFYSNYAITPSRFRRQEAVSDRSQT